MWEIYSIGDAAFLERVLNSLAMIAGTGNLEAVAGIGMLVGLIIMGFQSIYQGGEGIKFQNLLVAWIMYAMMFGSGARVAIEDVYSGQVRVVDNVPFGVAAAGSMVSQLGYGVTSLFEQAFGEAQMTKHGFAFALETLANLRKATLTQSAIGGANSPSTNDDVWKSWRNYIADCTMTGVSLKQYTTEEVMKGTRGGGSVLESLRFDSQAYGTEIRINGAPNNGFMTCTDAYVTLQAYTTTTFMDKLRKHLSVGFGVPETDVDDRIQQAFQAVDLAMIDSQNYMLATVMEPIFNWGQVDNELNFQRVAVATMLHTSIQQRNEQWAAEQALFNTVVRPMITFFEGMVYATAPMMAFLIGLGPMGVSLMGKYLLILIWIQLWMPILSVINLYLHMAVGKRMIALDSAAQGDTPLASFYGIHAMDQTLQTWIATGGMLASSVPAITLMLIYGGAVTATSLASRMSAGNVPTDHSTPSIASNAPLLERQSMRTSNDTHGLSATGAEQTKLQIGGNYSSTLGSSSEEMATKQAAFATQFGQQLIQSHGSMQQGMRAISAAAGESSQGSEVVRAGISYGNDLTKGLTNSEGISANTKAALATGVTAAVGLGAAGDLGVTDRQPIKEGNESAGQPGDKSKNPATKQVGSALKLDGKVAGQLLTQIGREAGLTEQQAQEFAERFGVNYSNSRDSSANFVNSLAKETRDTKQDSFTKNIGLTNSDSLNRSATDLLSTSDRYSANNQLQRSVGIASQYTNETLPGALRGSGLDDDVRQFVSNYGSQGGGGNSLHNLVNGYYQSLSAKNPGSRPEDTQLAAQAFAIADGRFLEGADPALRQQMALEGSNIFSRLAGMASPDQTLHNSNKGVGGDVDQLTAGVRERAEEGAVGTGLNPGQVRAGAEAGIDGAAQRIQNQSPAKEFGDAQKRVDAARDGYKGEYDNERGGMLVERMQKAAEMNRNATDTVGGASGIQANVSPQTLRDEGLLHVISGNSNLDAALSDAGLKSGLDRDKFLSMSDDQREKAAAEVHSALSQGMQRRGVNEDAANYAASLLLPEAMNQIYSGGGGLSSMLGLSPDHSAEDIRYAAHQASTDLRHQSHDKLHNGLMESTGNVGVTAMAMREVANSSALMMNLGTAEGAAIGAEMIDRTLSAAGYGGDHTWTPGGGNGPSSVPVEEPWYTSGGKSAAPNGNTQAQSDYMDQAPRAQGAHRENPIIR